MNRKRFYLVFSVSLWPSMLIAPLRSVEAQNDSRVVLGTSDVDVPGNLTLRDSTIAAESGPGRDGDIRPVGNILKGGVRFIHNSGTNNTFIGKPSGNLMIEAEANTGIGVDALQSDTRGDFNTAIGVDALNINTFGFNNTAIGTSSLSNNTEGAFNTATGAAALLFNATGSFNTATGYLALDFNSEGSTNTADGVSALQNNRYFNNTAIGFRALQNLSNFSADNSAFGAEALLSLSSPNSNNNTAIGRSALAGLVNGSLNTAVGAEALLSCTDGIANTAIGRSALGGSVNGRQNTALGAEALGSSHMFSESITAVGFGADVCGTCESLTNATAIGAGAIVDASNKIRLGNTAVTVVEGPPYSTVSDRNRKENFVPVDGEEVLQKIGGLSLMSWNYIGHDSKQFRHYGPMGQEFFAAFGHNGTGNIGSPITTTATDMEGILMIAVQALEKRTTDLMAARAENSDLKTRIEALERVVREQL